MQTITEQAPRPVAPPTETPVVFSRPPWWERRRVRILAVIFGVLGVLSLVAGLLVYSSSRSTRSEADEVAAEAAQTAEDADQAQATLEDAQQTLDRLVPLTNAVADAARDLDAAIQRGVDTWNRLNDMFGQATDQMNAGNVQAGQDLLRQQQPLFRAFERAVNGELEAVAQLDRAVSDFEEAMGDA